MKVGTYESYKVRILVMSFTLSCLRRQLPKSTTASPWYSIRYNSDSSSKLELPPHADWRSVFSPAKTTVRDRVSLASPETARLVAESFLGKDSIAGGSEKIVIEAFPGEWLSIRLLNLFIDSMSHHSGPGALSRALLKMDSSRIRKLIILEDHESYLDYLKVGEFPVVRSVLM